MTSSRAYIAGVTPKNLALAAARKAANPRYKSARLNGWQLSAERRLSEIKRLARLRLKSAAPIGAESSWIECVANALRVRHGAVTADMITAAAVSLRVGPFNAELVADAVEHIAKAAWGRYRLYSPKLAGDKLQMTAAERDRAGITGIAARDESASELRRRKDRERKADKRAAAAALAAPKIKKVELALALGITRPTLDAWIAKGIVDPETGELSDFTFPVRASLLLRNEKRTKNVKSAGKPT
jgi:hypothetical protein